jgi:hypothetical protein
MFRGIGASRRAMAGCGEMDAPLRATSAVTARATAGAAGELDGKI